MFQTLLKYGCHNIEAISKRGDVRDHAGYTLLQTAVIDEWVEGVDILLDCGADATAVSHLTFDRYNNVTVEDFVNFVYRLEQVR